MEEGPDETPHSANKEVLLIANLSPQTTKTEQIIRFFKVVGSVVSVRLIVDHECKHVGYGFVEFDSSYEAEKALKELNGEYLHDHKILLMRGLDDETPHSVEEAATVRNKTLFVSGLSRQTKISEIVTFFKDVGEVVHVRLIVDRWGNLQGKGFVEFASANEAMKALEKKNGEYLNGSDVFLAVFETPPYDRRPKYQDYLQRESLEIKEDVAAVEKGLHVTPHFTEEIVRKKTVFVDGLSYNTRISDIINFFKDVREEIIRVRFIVDGRGDHVGCCFVEMATANAAKKAVQENYNTSKFFVYAAEIAAQCPFQPKYKLADLAEKLWYEDSLRQKSLCGQKLKPILNENKVMEYDKKIILDEAPDFVEEAAVPIRTLFIASLSRHSTDISDIIDFFKDVGQVVRVRLDINDRGKLVGCGYVEFASANQANKALQNKNGEYLHDRKIFLADGSGATFLPHKFCIDHKVWYEEEDYLQEESLRLDSIQDVAAMEEGPDETPHSANKEVLLIANLSPQTTKTEQIIRFFEDVGSVFSVRLIVDHECKHVGYGFVEFDSSYEAEKALKELNGEYLHDHKILLMRGVDDETPHSVEEAATVRNKTLFVSGLSRQTKISEIINFFKDVGEVVHVRLIVFRWGNLHGKGFVEFASANEAMKALEKKNGEYLNGRDVFLAYFETPPYHRRPKYFIDHKVWYQDYLQRESLEIKEDVAAVEKGLDVTPHFTEEIVRKKTVFVDGLSYNTRISDIINFFKDVREEIIRVRFIVDGRGDHVGCCFVEMATANAAKKAVQENYNTSKFFVYAAEIAAQCPFQPKYKLADLAEKLWYEDSLRQKSLCGQKLKPILNENKVMEYDKKIILDEAPDFVEEAAVPIRTLFIASLSRHSTDISDIIDFFKDVGQVVRVRLDINDRGKLVGCGYVEFASANQANKALQNKNGEYLHDRKIFLADGSGATFLPHKFCIDHKVWYEEEDYLQEESLRLDSIQDVAAMEEGPDETPHSANKEVLLIANLSPQTTKTEQIIRFFEDVGSVVSVRLIVDHECKHVGYGFVEFDSSYEAEKALKELNGEYLHDHKILLMRGLDDETPHSVEEAATVRNKTLFVSGLSRQTKISEIINFFKDVGEVVHVRLIVFRWGNLHGKGFVEFASANEAMKALEKKNGEYLNGRDVFLAYFETPPYHRRPKYFIDHKVWYQDYLQRESLEIKEDVAAVEKGLDETPHFTEETVRKKTVFVDGLSYNTSISDIINFFKDVREEIIRVRLIVDGRGDHVGCCFVEMATANAAKKAVQENYNTSKFFVYAAEIAAPYPFQPKYKLADLAEKLWYEDSLCEKSLFGQKPKPILSIKKVMEYGYGKKTTFSDDE
ncbi:uncharacterized protein LOC103864009 isoform X2 [Brassica rapa]|uniref:uncharacterized protein LOC103864009 isoform X2 n=1 Tax=Brassica campestris TaxID=3711 RepID=UPI00142D3275|nr:uncharacterized protein LOC103864009 isoform X2 [Brassica rapa]